MLLIKLTHNQISLFAEACSCVNGSIFVMDKSHRMVNIKEPLLLYSLDYNKPLIIIGDTPTNEIQLREFLKLFNIPVHEIDKINQYENNYSLER